jgi:hypothetical protein
MTVVGKILAFVNLVFSVAVGALIILVYVTRTNWAEGYNKTKAAYDAAVASRDEYAQRANRAQAERDTAVAQKAALNATLEKYQQDAEKRADVAEGKADKQEKTVTASQATTAGAADTVGLKTREADTLRAEVVKANQEKIKLVEDRNEATRSRPSAWAAPRPSPSTWA